MATTRRPTIERRKARAAPWRPRPGACLRAASWRQTRSCYAGAPDLMAARVENGRVHGHSTATPTANRVRGSYTLAAKRRAALSSANRTSAATIRRTHCADAPDEWRMRALRIARCFMSCPLPLRLTMAALTPTTDTNGADHHDGRLDPTVSSGTTHSWPRPEAWARRHSAGLSDDADGSPARCATRPDVCPDAAASSAPGTANTVGTCDAAKRTVSRCARSEALSVISCISDPLQRYRICSYGSPNGGDSRRAWMRNVCGEQLVRASLTKQLLQSHTYRVRRLGCSAIGETADCGLRCSTTSSHFALRQPSG